MARRKKIKLDKDMAPETEAAAPVCQLEPEPEDHDPLVNNHII